MTQNRTRNTFLRLAAVAFAAQALSPALAPAAALPPVTAGDEHVAEGKGVRVTALWRSERALDQYAQEGLRIVQGVVEGSKRELGEGEVLSLGLAASSQALRRLQTPEESAGNPKRRRRRKRAAEGQSDGEASSDTELSGVPIVVSGLDWVLGGQPVVAVAPKIHDRVMFGTGLPPVTRWALALEAAHLCEPEGDLLGLAFTGMTQAGFAKGLVDEPYLATGLRALQLDLRAIHDLSSDDGAADQASFLARQAALPNERIRTMDRVGPFAATASQLAKHCVSSGWDVPQILALEPQWLVESGAVGSHGFGWQAVATRRADAVALSVEPRTSEPFTLRTSVVALSNDIKVPAQADLILGDNDGHRYQLVCNTREGIYLFHRAGPEEPYEAVADRKETVIPTGRPVEVVVVWRDHTLVITVGGVELAGIVLPEDAMAGHFGFGAHAGSTVMFSELKFD